MSHAYYLASRFPVLWQIGFLKTVAVSIVSSILTYLYGSGAMAGVQANAIPDVSVPFHFFLLANVTATLFWLFRSTQHFRVGVTGCKTASPSILFIFVTIATLWVPTFLFTYVVNSALKSTAPFEVAVAGYNKMQSTNVLFDATSHYEATPAEGLALPAPQILVARDRMKSLAESAAGPIRSFAPPPLNELIGSLFEHEIPACALSLPEKNRAEVTDALEKDFSRRIEDAGSQALKELVQRERAYKLELIGHQYQLVIGKFQECITQASISKGLGIAELAKAIRSALRNAYLISYAHGSYGRYSSNYLEYSAAVNFAAPELRPFSYGDITSIAVILWIIGAVSIVYASAEYVDTPTLAAASRNIVVCLLLLILILPLIDFAPPVQRSINNALWVDTWAATLHWPALTFIPVALCALLSAVLPSSTNRSRILILVTTICFMPVLQIEVLNAIDTLAANSDFSGSSCFGGAGFVKNWINCSVYPGWLYLVGKTTIWLSSFFNWRQFWLNAGSRIAISIIFSTLISWLWVTLFIILLKREFARPRDQ